MSIPQSTQSGAAAATHGGRQIRRLALATEAGREYFESVCSDVSRVVLRPLRDGNTREYPATLVGRLEGASLLIDWPSDKDGLIPLRVGERVEVKFFSERDLILFQVDVSLCCFRPRPYLHLAWPKDIACVEVREVARMVIDKAATFVAAAAEGAVATPVPGRIIDLSLGGAAFVTDHGALAAGVEGELLLSIQPDSGTQSVYIRPHARIRSRRENTGTPASFQYGLQFVHPNLNDRLVLLAIVGESTLHRQE